MYSHCEYRMWPGASKRQNRTDSQNSDNKKKRADAENWKLL